MLPPIASMVQFKDERDSQQILFSGIQIGNAKILWYKLLNYIDDLRQ